MLSSHVLFLLSLSLFVTPAIIYLILMIENKAKFKGIGYWLIASLSLALSTALFLFRNNLPISPVQVFANFLMLLTACLFYTGLLQFKNVYKKKHLFLQITIAIITIILLAIFSYVKNIMIIRTGVMSLSLGIIIILSIKTIYNKKMNYAEIMIISFYSLAFVVNIVRFIYFSFSPMGSKTAFFSEEHTMLLTAIGVCYIGFSYGFLFLINSMINKDSKTLAHSKELLLRESHHRINNNLSIVQSLLSIEAGRLEKGSQAENSITECINRIGTISKVHDMLYKQKNLQDNRLDRYIETVVFGSAKSFGIPEDKIEIHFSPVSTNIDQLVVCGLLVNEIITNACKYTFPGNDAGKIIMEMNTKIIKKETFINLNIDDNGPGIPEKYLNNYQSTFGLQMIHQLVDQLSGTIDIHNANGTHINIKIPLKEYTDPQ